MPNKNRSKRSSVKSNVKFVTRKQLRRENHLIETGARFNPSIHPPDFCAVPWFNLIVRIADFNNITVGIDTPGVNKSIPTELKTQLSLPADTVIDYRIQNIRIWGPIVAMNSNSSLSNIRAKFYSLVPLVSVASGSSSFALLEDITAYPDQVSRASIGFVYPKAQQSVTLQQLSNGPVVQLVAGAGSGNIAYIKVLWRPRPSLVGFEETFEAINI